MGNKAGSPQALSIRPSPSPWKRSEQETWLDLCSEHHCWDPSSIRGSNMA